ncbi:VCBS repeat-containing protein [soil metagenome]
MTVMVLNLVRKALLGGLLAGIFLGSMARSQSTDLAEYYGFQPLEIYKLDTRISNLLIADFDGDGIDDVAVANNARSRIDLLLSSEGPADEQGNFGFGPNRLPSDRRMRIKSVPVNKAIVSLQAGDFNGNGRLDLAFYGTPAELTILENEGGARFGRPRRINTGSAVDSGSALAVGDLNQDGRDDLALLTADDVVIVLQDENGTLRSPERLPHTAPRPSILKLVDLDGDGADDLAILTGNDEAPIRVRFSRAGGTLGPEERFRIESPRAIAYGEIDGQPGAELLTIESQSGRVRAFTLEDGSEEADDRRGRLIFYPLPQGNTRGRSLALGDLDGDGRQDVVVTDPESAQFFVHLQGAEGEGLGTCQTFPGLAGGKLLRLADLDGDGRDEVYVLSEKERQIGRSRLADGRLTFPTRLPTGGEPVALEAADLDGDGTPELLYVTRDTDQPERAKGYSLRALKHEGDGRFTPFQWSSSPSVPIEGLSGAPEALRVLDVDGDGRLDILVFDPYGPPVLLLGRDEGEPPSRSSAGAGPLAGIRSGALTVSELDEAPTLLVAQNSFIRQIELDDSGQWQVTDQYNTGRSSAQAQAALAIDTNGDGEQEIAVLDRTSRSLLFLDRQGGVFRPGPTLPIGTIDFQGLHVADLDGDGTDDLLIAGTEKFGVVLTGSRGRQLKGIASYATTRTDARLSDLIVGDLNSSGRADVILTDTIEHFIEILAVSDPIELERALAFKVFEQKSFRNLSDLLEPREIALGDVDGDGRTDLILIVHDRVLIYRQDPGPETSDKDELPEEESAPATGDRAENGNDP